MGKLGIVKWGIVGEKGFGRVMLEMSLFANGGLVLNAGYRGEKELKGELGWLTSMVKLALAPWSEAASACRSAGDKVIVW